MIVVFGLLLAGIIETTTGEQQCKPVEINGYLHEQCLSDNNTTSYKCPRSNNEYQLIGSLGYCDFGVFTDICPSDPGFYQACGHGGCSGHRDLGGTPLLCGTFLCKYISSGSNVFGNFMATITKCVHFCINTELNMIGCKSSDTKCNNICEYYICSDESDCNGVTYGVRCECIAKMAKMR
eukprot:sb/3471719/